MSVYVFVFVCVKRVHVYNCMAMMLYEYYQHTISLSQLSGEDSSRTDVGNQNKYIYRK